MREKIQKYCPNILFSENNISIGEFKTLEEVKEYPLSRYWFLDFKNSKLFTEQRPCRILIICSWDRQDEERFVIALLENNEVSYFDMNVIPMITNKDEFEDSIGKKARDFIYSLLV